jgi:Ser/Thr protein kinase RdoA (MazF antagonist)
MTNHQLNLIFESFSPEGHVKHWEPYGHGHINDTFLGRNQENEASDFILQRKNHKIFTNVPGMMNNIVAVTEHIRKGLEEKKEADIDRKVMRYFPAKDGKWYVNDNQGNYWTLFLYIPGSHSVENIENPEQAMMAARAFGHFQLQLADLAGNKLVETIPNFHNGISRLNDFRKAIEQDQAGRVAENRELLEQLLTRADEMTLLQKWLDSGELPLRITHNDTKINNILFDENDQPLCIIDLDTVMPGSALYDFGDAIRTIGNTAPEDEPDLSRIGFSSDIFQAFAEGYLAEAGKFLTPKERENLSFSCLYMAWEQAIRFMTDYLNGDTYYKIAYPEHNLVRTKAQFRYLEVLEENREAMEQFIGKVG